MKETKEISDIKRKVVDAQQAEKTLFQVSTPAVNCQEDHGTNRKQWTPLVPSQKSLTNKDQTKTKVCNSLNFRIYQQYLCLEMLSNRAQYHDQSV